MSKTMRAAGIDEFGSPDVLQIRDVERPSVSPDEVLVRVIAAGVQLTDAAVQIGRASCRERV